MWYHLQGFFTHLVVTHYVETRTLGQDSVPDNTVPDIVVPRTFSQADVIFNRDEANNSTLVGLVGAS